MEQFRKGVKIIKTLNYTVSHLSSQWARQIDRIESLYPLWHEVTAAVLKVATKDAVYDERNWQFKHCIAENILHKTET
jgi:urease accessory protein UreF